MLGAREDGDMDERVSRTTAGETQRFGPVSGVMATVRGYRFSDSECRVLNDARGTLNLIQAAEDEKVYFFNFSS